MKQAWMLAAALGVVAACAPNAAQNVSASIGASQLAASGEKVSAPSQYQGYSAPVYNGHARTSSYVPMRDGTKLAMDLYRPTKDGELADEKLPVVWMHSPYNRREFQGGEAALTYPGFALKLVPYGYNVAVVDFRGVYASYGLNIGYNRGEWVETAKWDSYDVTEWLAAQPWSSGKIGMWGCSATGGSQMQTLTTRPPSLKAVIPMSAEFEAYPFVQLGGVSAERIAPPSGGGTQDAIAKRDAVAVAVDGPEGEAMLKAAIASHKDNIDSVGYVPFHDSVSKETGLVWWELANPASYLDQLKKDGIGVFNVANWDEAGTRHGSFFTFNNIDPDHNKLLVGPGRHCAWSDVKETTGFDLVTEELRFYDHWLKGVENGVMDEPAVTYFTYNAPEADAWRQSEVWPLAEEVRTDFYLTNNGLSDTRATTQQMRDVAFGPAARTSTVFLPPIKGGANFETPVLSEDLEITGHPVVQLWLSSGADDIDVTARLEDVAPDGKTTSYQFIGRLRASHRGQQTPPYDYLGLPWRSHAEADVSPVTPGEAMELEFEMLPMSYIFKAGHKVRLNLTFAAKDGSTEHVATVLSGPETPSRLVLPVIP